MAARQFASSAAMIDFLTKRENIGTWSDFVRHVREKASAKNDEFTYQVAKSVISFGRCSEKQAQIIARAAAKYNIKPNMMICTEVTDQKLYSETVIDIDTNGLQYRPVYTKTDEIPQFLGTIAIDIVGCGWTEFAGIHAESDFEAEYGFKIIYQ